MMSTLGMKETTALNKKELLALINEAYYDIDYATSDNAKMKGEDTKYLKQAMGWLEEIQKLLKKKRQIMVQSNT